MSVCPIDFRSTPGQWQVLHDDAPGGAHAGSVTPANVQFAPNPDGTPNFRGLLVTCPVCQAASVHPIGGGAAAAQVQELFIRKIVAAGMACPCGALPAGRPLLLVLAHIKGHVTALEGADRWQLGSSLAP